MLAATAERLTAQLAEDDLVLDVGGWARPFNRADHVIDLMPYESRGEWGADGPAEERFTSDTWTQRDICAREPWPFENRQFDFAVCAQTLEDVRDPIWVCSELTRVARAGYVEVPSRLVEQCFAVQGPWVGYGHHHWLIDVEAESITFTFKHHIIHGHPEFQFPEEFKHTLAEDEKVATLWWEGSFAFAEQVLFDPNELHEYLAGFVRRATEERPSADGKTRRGALQRLRRRIAR